MPTNRGWSDNIRQGEKIGQIFTLKKLHIKIFV
jgi:hypothetical protein